MRRYVEFVALCFLAAVFFWWFGRKLDWAQVREAVSRANWALLVAATAIISAAYLVRALRWRALLAPLGPAGLRDLFIATTVGFGALFLVGRIGEVVRPVVLPMRDSRVRASASFVTIVIERIYDMMAVIVLFAVNLLWFKPPVNAGNEFSRVRLAGMVLLLAAILGLAFLIWFRRRSSRAIGWLRPRLEGRRLVPARLAQVFFSILEQLARALRVLVDARELAVTIGWTALMWTGIALANLLVLRAFGLQQFGITATVFVLGWSLVGSLVPTPGGAAGAFHAATAAGLIFLGLTRETAAAISIVMHLVDFGPALIFAFFFLLRGDINLSRLRAQTTPEAVEHAVENQQPDEALSEKELQTTGASH